MSIEAMTKIDNLKSWTSGVDVDWESLNQLRNIAALPVLAGHVAVMPDVHLGKGATVGSVIPTKAAIIPAAVGVDIGCEMIALRTDISANELPDTLARFRSGIEKRVPVGFNHHDSPVNPLHDGLRGVGLVNASKNLDSRYEKLAIMDVIGKYDHKRVFNQLGTLGGGNHFIELCLDESNAVWVMLHSGSRNIGKTIGETAIHMAREIADVRNAAFVTRTWLGSMREPVEFDIYVEGLRWAQDYAMQNRALMMHAVLLALREEFGRDIATFDTAIQCHHNYANVEEHFGQQVWVTRKGAVSARAGELGIIPGSMGAKSFIVRGKGNTDSYCSCSHGAGRRLPRGAAKRTYTLADLEVQTAGVECRKDEGVLDEIPGAYKDIDTVMAAQTELVEVVHTLKQVMCING